jgi:hypothetical protein
VVWPFAPHASRSDSAEMWVNQRDQLIPGLAIALLHTLQQQCDVLGRSLVHTRILSGPCGTVPSRFPLKRITEDDLTIKLSAILVIATTALSGACRQPEQRPANAAPTTAQASPAGTVISPRILEDSQGTVAAVGDMVTETLPPELAEHIPNFVIRLKSLWTPGQTVQVCFFGGDTALRSRIRDAASVWAQHGNIKLDFGPATGSRTCAVNDASHVRIGFRFAGYWSVVGNTAVQAGVQTMNYGGYDTAPPPEPRFTGVVLHEFGHALGFEHEHQHPQGGCDAEFNWPVVYAELAKPPNNWPPAKVDFNLRAFTDMSAYGISAPDRTSIMHYSLDPWMFHAGERSKCFVREQFALSDLDKKGIASVYPARAEQLLNEQQRRLDQLIKTLPADAASARTYLQNVERLVETKIREVSRQQ